MALSVLSLFARDAQSKRRLQAGVLGPALTAALMTALVAGCSATTDTTVPNPSGDAMSSSSSDAGAMMSSMSSDAGLNGTVSSDAVSSSDSAMSVPASSASDQAISSSDPTVPASSAPADMSSSSPAAAASAYKDGTYTAVGDYTSPAGPEEVDVSLTLKDGTITDATFQGTAQGGRSQMFQGQFAQGYKQYVVGQPIASLSLGVVNGSSLTPLGFMDAVTKIEAQAQS